jgi:hypothetical protein
MIKSFMPVLRLSVKAWICWKNRLGMACLIGSFGIAPVIEILADGNDLTKLELSEAQAAPTLGGAQESTEHQPENELFAEAIGDGLQTAALLNEQTFKNCRDRYDICGVASTVAKPTS